MTTNPTEKPEVKNSPENTKQEREVSSIDDDNIDDFKTKTEQKLKQKSGIFIAHGKNKTPLGQLKKILDKFKIPYKVATEEPNLGRPISSKVREIMESCNCAILIFTADEIFYDKDKKEVLRPSENVVFELGAAGYVYDNNIVILKEEGVDFPVNFNDLGYIPFEKDNLEAKSMDVIQELLGFGILKLTT